MPLDKYKTFYDIVVMLTHMELTKLRSIAIELKQLSKVKLKKRKGTKKGMPLLFPASIVLKKRKGTKKGMRRKTARRAYEGLKRKKQ